MKFSKQWLEQYLGTQLSPEQLADQLTMAGFEVESIEPVAPDFSAIVVGQVLTVDKHPNADKLNICQVDVAQTEPLSIVCGAPNVKAEMKIPVALLGAELPGGFKIKKAKLRGVESSGMLCSAKELGLAEVSEGLLALSSDAPVGQDVREFLNLNDVAIDLSVTPNRGDCLSIRGIAREVSTINKIDFNQKNHNVEPEIKDIFSANISAPQGCARYVGRVIKNINIKAESPLWLQESLRRSGLRSVDPVVDVTNYVLLELGQPLHAFDLDKLKGAIDVRFAKSGETLDLLNDESVELNDKTLLITDKSGPIAIAGVMGGLHSSVTQETTNIFLESAFFDPISLAGCARSYGLQTDAAFRFERGVDPALQVKAIERATELLLSIVGGEPGPVVETSDEKYLPRPITLSLHLSKIEKLLGIQIADQTTEDILTRLGFEITKKDQSIWTVIAPSWRFDMSIEEDLIEEIARIYGYNNIPVQHYQADVILPLNSAAKIPLHRIQNFMRNRGYHETITYSFIDEKNQRLFDPEGTLVTLDNPIASNMSIMRTTLWPSLVEVLLYNLNRQQNRVRLFETGLRFKRDGDDIVQERMLAGLAYGPALPEQWDSEKALVNFFDVKGDLEALFKLGYDQNQFTFKTGVHAALHPGQSAEIYKENVLIGYVGALHPTIQQKLKIPKMVYLFELLLEPIQQAVLPSYVDVSKFPAARRDIAIVLEKAIPYADIKAVIDEAAGDFLTDLVVFDLYQGKEDNFSGKNIALGLTFQHPSRTLNDSEINNLVSKVINLLEVKLGAKLRD